MFNQNQINKLGVRLRSSAINNDDIAELEAYRESCDDFLLQNTDSVALALQKYAIDCVFAGRSKRTKSTIRKLTRPKNASMDLSRMVDLIGLRLVVKDINTQNRVVEILEGRFFPKEKIDYREDGQPYRAIHLHLHKDRDFRRLEIQIRTLPQQLWANESESFGEQVKAGEGPIEVRDYLNELSSVTRSIDRGAAIAVDSLVSPYFSSRATLSFRLPQLESLFATALADKTFVQPGTTFVVVLDNETNALLHRLKFASADRHEAVSQYQRFTYALDNSRYETLILNSPLNFGLRVTHPRFFPESA